MRTLPDVVATVNGVPIKKQVMEASLNAVRVNPMMFGAGLPKSQDEIAKAVLDQLISAELLAQEATAKGIQVPDAEVEANLLEMKKQFANEAEWAAVLKDTGMSEDAVRADARRQIAIKRLFERELLPKVPVVDAKTAREFYDANPFQFTEPEESRVSHVLIIADADFPAARTADAKKRAEKALADAKAGKDFAELAKKVSEDKGSRELGGDVGYLSRTEWPPEFLAAAAALKKPGDLSGVVQTRFGFHVIKMTEKLPAKRLPFDTKLEREIIQVLDKRRQEDAALDYVAALRKRAKVVTF